MVGCLGVEIGSRCFRASWKVELDRVTQSYDSQHCYYYYYTVYCNQRHHPGTGTVPHLSTEEGTKKNRERYRRETDNKMDE